MKFFDVEMEITYTKTLRVKAEDAPTAEMLAALVFMDTDAIQLTSADLEEFDADVFARALFAEKIPGATSD